MSSSDARDELPGLLSFLLELDELKGVQRRSYVNAGLRRENSAEHSWHVAIAAWLLSRRAEVSLDLERLLLLAIAHDLGEIDAGDVSVHAAAPAQRNHDEAAGFERLRQFAPRLLHDFPGLFEEYEAQLTAESQWVKVADRILPFLHNLASAGRTWREQNIERAQVLRVNAPIARTDPALFRFIEAEVERAVAKGWLRETGAPASSLPLSAAGIAPKVAARLDFGRLLLRGSEVTLRPLELADADALDAAAAEARDHYDYTPVPNGLAQARAYVERALQMRADGQRYAFAIVWQGRVVGSTSYYDFQAFEWPEGSALAGAPGPDVVEIGHTWLAASAQRTRCNSEAKFLLLEQAFEIWRTRRVRLRTDERNARSRAAIARLGARFEGIQRGDKPGVDGTLRNAAGFSILAEEWPEISARLRARLATD
jgi:RimJ/RimL family protein N-acetyltransferase/5'-deoxynucleotidase YfbR-like HD superfamily hydrolase